MGVTLKIDGGKIRPWWHVEIYKPDKTRTVFKINVPVEGTPPANGKLTEQGDAAFERSRERAKAEFRRLKEEANQGRMNTADALRMYKQKTGVPLVLTPTGALRNVFDGDTLKVSKFWLGTCRITAASFADWLEEQKIRTVLDVTVSHARAFLNELYDPKKPLYTAQTVRGKRGILAKAFDRLLPDGAPNPFRHPTLKVEKMRDDEEAHRKPLNEEELERLLEVAKEVDAEAYDWIVCAVTTGLRRGDVCALEWESVDLQTNELNVRTRKTGTKLCLPVLPLLREVLKRRKKESGGGRFVFPEAERLMRTNPSGVTYRVKKIFAAAFAETMEEEAADTRPIVELPDVIGDVLSAMRKSGMTPEKRKRMEAVLSLYAQGKSSHAVGQETGLSQPKAIRLLREAETAAGVLFVRRHGRRRTQGMTTGAAIAKVTRTKRVVGMMSASRYDFHCLRTTFVTLAISRGFSIDKLRALTGHTTVDLVMRHYFKPKGSDFAEQLAKAMPGVLTRPHG